MSLPDPSTVRTDPCPEGYHYEWVPENAFGWHAWRVVAPETAKRCRWRENAWRCPNQSVAKLDRSKRGIGDHWWHYCADHLFGRAVDGRRVWVIHTIPDEENVDA